MKVYSTQHQIAIMTEEAYKELAAGNDQIVIGGVGPAETFNEIIDHW